MYQLGLHAFLRYSTLPPNAYPTIHAPISSVEKEEYARYWFSVKLSKTAAYRKMIGFSPICFIRIAALILLTRNQPNTCAEAGIEPASVEYESTRLPLPYTPQYKCDGSVLKMHTFISPIITTPPLCALPIACVCDVLALPTDRASYGNARTNPCPGNPIGKTVAVLAREPMCLPKFVIVPALIF